VRHAIILAHPLAESFNGSAARAYVQAIEAASHTADLRDLYGMGFDPRLPAHELPGRPDFGPSPDVRVEREALAAAQVIVFVYPLWFNAPPAMLKGYVERVLGLGFAYEPALGGTRPLLTGKSLVSISTSGAPDAWVDRTSAVARLRGAFDDHVAAVCGLTVLEHLHLGGVTPGIRADAAQQLLGRVTKMAVRLFGLPTTTQRQRLEGRP
jgi:NAD(P)H dehydrogenase (quinone)